MSPHQLVAMGPGPNLEIRRKWDIVIEPLWELSGVTCDIFSQGATLEVDFRHSSSRGHNRVIHAV